jgi:hypothetical protein
MADFVREHKLTHNLTFSRWYTVLPYFKIVCRIVVSFLVILLGFPRPERHHVPSLSRERVLGATANTSACARPFSRVFSIAILRAARHPDGLNGGEHSDYEDTAMLYNGYMCSA